MKRRPRRRYGKWAALAAGGLAALYFGGKAFQGAQKPVYPPHAFYAVTRGDMLISVIEDGALRALNETVIRSGLDGLNRVIQLAPEGSQVKKGELLVELDSSTLKDRLDEQEVTYQERLFQLAQAQANLKIQKSLIESQIKASELAVENAGSDLEKYRDGDAPLLLKTVESRSGVLAEQVRIASERHERTQELFRLGNATRFELEADALSLKREQLALSQYQEDLRLIQKFDYPKQLRLLESNVAQARDELNRLKQRTSNEIAQAEADLKTSQRTIDFMEEGLETQRDRLKNAKIFAPQDGLVVYASVSPFQSMGGNNEPRRDEGRFRQGGRGGGREGSGEYRGGGQRGGRSNSEGSGSRSTGSSSSTTETIAAGNQRIASAVSGSAATQTGGGTGSGGGGSGSGGGGGGRSGGASGSGTTSASSAFVTYPSMRPSSTLGAAAASTGNTGGSGGSGSGGSSGSGMSTSGQMQTSASSQFNSRNNSQFGTGFMGNESSGSSGFLEEGAMVRQRQELIRLPDVSKMLVELKVHESRVAQVRPGMTTHIRIENIPGRRFKGIVRRVAPMPDSQASWLNPNLKVYPTDVLIEEELPLLKPGVSARAEIVITNLTQVLTVPIHTVARWRGDNVCFVKRGSGVVPVPVTTGWFNEQFVEVTSGLQEGDAVLLAPEGDEAIAAEESAETNSVTEVPPQPVRPEEPAAPAPAEERRVQRGNSEEGGERSSERRRNRQGSGRRPQSNGDGPE